MLQTHLQLVGTGLLVGSVLQTVPSSLPLHPPLRSRGSGPDPGRCGDGCWPCPHPFPPALAGECGKLRSCETCTASTASHNATGCVWVGCRTPEEPGKGGQPCVGGSKGLPPSLHQPLLQGWDRVRMVPAAQHPWVPGPSCFLWSKSVPPVLSRGEAGDLCQPSRQGCRILTCAASSHAGLGVTLGTLPLPGGADGAAPNDGGGRKLALL